MENKDTNTSLHTNHNESLNNHREEKYILKNNVEDSTTQENSDLKTTQENNKSEYILLNNTTEISERHFQQKFGDTIGNILTTELNTQNGLNYKPQEDESVPCKSKSDVNKNIKETVHCPIYYGIKSYIHDFYCPPDKDVLKSGEFMQGEDFQFLVEPGRRKNCCIRIGFWIGINLILLGIIGVMVGYLTPQRETIVGQLQEYTILDLKAVTFNNHLVLCQLTGLATVACGTVVVVCCLLVSTCQPPQSPMYYMMGDTLNQSWTMHRMPFSKIVKGVQPNFILSQ